MFCVKGKVDELSKIVSAVFTIMFLLSLLSVNKCQTVAGAAPQFVTVDDNGVANYTRIQEAINKVPSGSTIFVRNGTYNENVVVNKTVTLIGENMEGAIVDSLKFGTVINVTAGNVSISNFTVRNSGLDEIDSGIRLEMSTGNTIARNRIVGNTIGVSLFSSSNNAVQDNDVVSSGLHGIYLYSSDTSTISNNNVSSKSYGISLYSSNNDMISNNTVQSSTYVGINLYSSVNNVFTSNTIMSSNFAGMVFYSNNNTFYHNNFINSTNQFSIQSGQNVWDNGAEGNYWSNYTRQDSNQDGIGDVHYSVGDGDQDNYPLMGTYSSFIATFRGKPYQVATISNATVSTFSFKVGAETGNRIISFNVLRRSGNVTFCRITIPNELMKYPYIVVVNDDEASPALLSFSNETFSYLYLTCQYPSQAVTIVYSDTQHIYDELNTTYQAIRADLDALGVYYQALLDIYSSLLGNYSTLRESYDALNASYNEHLSNYLEQMQNFQNLMYIFACATAIFLVMTVYLSKHAHERSEVNPAVSK